MSDDINALFEQLLEFKWNDIGFPTSKFSVRLRHDLAQHKYPGKDGANIEATGRAPLQITATIPFLNGAVPGKGESWQPGLYPFQYRKFITAVSLGDTGVLQHPEFDQIPCKVDSCETIWDATRRDGVIVECTWLETIEPGDDGLVAVGSSPIAQVLLGAIDLDAQIRDASPPFPTLPVYEPDFAAGMRSLTAASDQISLAGKRVSGKIAAFVYRLNALETSIDNAQATPKATVKDIISPDATRAARDVLFWPVRHKMEALRAGLTDLKQVLGTNGRPVRVYVTQVPMTLAAIAQSVGAPIDEVLQLNTIAALGVTIEPRTPIRYYAA